MRGQSERSWLLDDGERRKGRGAPKGSSGRKPRSGGNRKQPNRRDPGETARGVRQWLAAPKGKGSTSGGGRAASAPRANGATAGKTNASPAELKRLESKISRLEDELAKSRRRQRELEDKLDGKGRAPASGTRGRVDLNRASFEKLRELGLSVSQSARVVSARDTAGGFSSIDELDQVPGLPKQTRAELKQRVTVRRARRPR